MEKIDLENGFVRIKELREKEIDTFHTYDELYRSFDVVDTPA